MHRGFRWFVPALAVLPALWALAVVAFANGPAQAQPAARGISDAEWSKMLSLGETRFNKVCGVCHPDGEEDIGPQLKGKRYTPEKVKTQVRAGSESVVGGRTRRMKAITLTKLPDPELDAVLVYLEKIGAANGVRAFLAKNR